ncbi:MAG: FkbM family methyltransferase, partial [Phycisphaerae bacterium]|nr:FkbM family methyltransferase [Phycisphaerae bacterium]
MRGDLVFDIGMCDGADTAYYLRLGFRVVAVEADPELCDAGRARFADAIARGQLTLVSKAIVGDASAGGTVTLWVNPENREWNTAAGAPAASRNATRRVEVPAVRLASLFGEFGVPLYLKVDIEGMDRVCAEAIEPSERPRFVSLELC